MTEPDTPGDLLVLTISGVQRLIRESRTTVDLRAGSEMVARLALEAARTLKGDPAVRLIFPSPDWDMASAETDGPVLNPDALLSVPNRIVALVPTGDGASAVNAAVRAVDDLWKRWLTTLFGQRLPDTPGMPSVQWVHLTAEQYEGYGELWKAGQAALNARRRVRDFVAFRPYEERVPCALSPRWPAERRPPRYAPPHDRSQLSATNWVKRCWQQVQARDASRNGGDAASSERSPVVGFPSTNSIASAPFRAEVLARITGEQPDVDARSALADLKQAVDQVRDDIRTADGQPPRERWACVSTSSMPRDDEVLRWLVTDGGSWVYPETWDAKGLWRDNAPPAAEMPTGFPAVVARGVVAARSLTRAMGGAPPSYLAVLVQDLDSMGDYLRGDGTAQDGTRIAVTADAHANVSERLVQLGDEQRKSLEAKSLHGVPVYTGGDDLLALVPASTALLAAEAIHASVSKARNLPTASTAVLFFHRTSSLRQAVTAGQELLKQAKHAHSDKHALGVGFLRRSGVQETTIHPWGTSEEDLATRDLRVFAATRRGSGLSPRLVSELERDEQELRSLAWIDADLFGQEITRLVVRHHGSDEDAQALLRLMRSDRSRSEDRYPDELPTGDTTTVDAACTPARAARVAVFLRQECLPVIDGTRAAGDADAAGGAEAASGAGTAEGQQVTDSKRVSA